MTSLTGTGPAVVSQGIFQTSTDQMHNLGEKAYANDGRVYRYARAGGTALVVGTLQQAAAEVTANQNLTAVAAAVDSITVSSSTAITITANQYAGGFLMVSVTPGQGYSYKIKSHAAFSAAAPTFTLEDPIIVALTTASRFDLVINTCNGVVINPITATGVPTGVAVVAAAASTYTWLQIGGTANVLADGAVVVGTNVAASNAVAGAVEAATGVQASVGIAVTGIATGEYGAVKLTDL